MQNLPGRVIVDVLYDHGAAEVAAVKRKYNQLFDDAHRSNFKSECSFKYDRMAV